MKSILKNKISLFTSLVLVVVMVFGSVSYAAEDDSSSDQVVFTDDMFTDSGYNDGSLGALDSIWGMVGSAMINESGMYESAVNKWGADNVAVYYINASNIGNSSYKYTYYYSTFIFCEKNTRVGLFKDNSSEYVKYYYHANKSFMYYQVGVCKNTNSKDHEKKWSADSFVEYNTAWVPDQSGDCKIISTNLPRFDLLSDSRNYLDTGKLDGALNFDNPDANDSSAFKWDTFKGVLSVGDDHDNYALVIDRSYSSKNMLLHPEDYYINGSCVLKIVGVDGNGAMYTGGYSSKDLTVRLDKFINGYAYNLSDFSVISTYGSNTGSFFEQLKKGSLECIQTIVRTAISLFGESGDNNFIQEIKSCRLYFTFRLYCKSNGMSLGRYSDDVRCLSFDLLNYDGSSQGGEAVDPAEGTENGGGAGGGSGGGTGDISQGINININNENTQNNGTGAGSDNSPKIDVADDDFSMSNVWKNVKSLFGLIDDPSTPEPDDGVMQVVKAGMDFLPSQYWTIILGLLSSAGIVSIIRIFRGS